MYAAASTLVLCIVINASCELSGDWQWRKVNKEQEQEDKAIDHVLFVVLLSLLLQPHPLFLSLLKKYVLMSTQSAGLFFLHR